MLPIHIFFCLFWSLSPTATSASSRASERIQPQDLTYRGAFKLPDLVTHSFIESWDYGGHAMAYFPGGDARGPLDGYPGSIFACGHAWAHLVAEIDIPVPVISASKNPEDLNTADQLQPFSDILNVRDLEIPRSGLAILPQQGSQAAGKLYFCWGYHMQEGPASLTHGWCETDLSDPEIRRGWYLGGLPVHIRNLSTNDYMCEIPTAWSDLYLPGMHLATGRFRDGGWSGQGPALFAIGPWSQGDPPPSGSALPNEPLLLYSSTYTDSAGNHRLDGYHHSDEWSGVAWLTAGEKSALVFVGSKGKGDCWYGNSQGPCLECDNRGWWSDEFSGQILFFDTKDLADVALGLRQMWEPQPYAVMEIDEYLFHVTSNQQKDHVGAACFDSAHGLLYICEPYGDGAKPLVHVWQVGSGADLDEPPSRRKKSSRRR